MSKRSRHFSSQREALATVCIYATGILMVVAFAVIHYAGRRWELHWLTQGLLVLAAVAVWALVSLICILVIETDPQPSWQPAQPEQMCSNGSDNGNEADRDQSRVDS